MIGPLTAFVAAGAGLLGTKAALSIVEPKTIDVIVKDTGTLRIVSYHRFWPISRKHKRFRAEVLRANLWLPVPGIDDPDEAVVRAKAQAMLGGVR